MAIFDLFKSPQDESEPEQLASFKKELFFALFSTGFKKLPGGCDTIPHGRGHSDFVVRTPFP